MSPSGEVDEGRFRLAMGRFPTGVSVVSARAGEHDHAMTANAVASVSVEPLLLLVCVEREARFHDAIVQAGAFGVSILAADQRATAQWLATRGRPLHGQLDRVPHVIGSATGSPLLIGSLATLECRTTDVHVAGDHSIVVGEVVAVDLSDTTQPALTWYRSGYGTIA
jgi:flavin reductase (DIM6/NTAB) family NADH-FMN oxidoreductase RutF